jgi:hypothetical protein
MVSATLMAMAMALALPWPLKSVPDNVVGNHRAPLWIPGCFLRSAVTPRPTSPRPQHC